MEVQDFNEKMLKRKLETKKAEAYYEEMIDVLVTERKAASRREWLSSKHFHNTLAKELNDFKMTMARA